MGGAKRLILLIGLNIVIGVGMWFGFRWTEQRDQKKQLDSTATESVSGLTKWPVFPSAHPDQAHIAVANWHGQRFAINFWASWCTACSEERPQLLLLGTEFPQNMLGLGTLDSLAQIKESESTHPHPYPVAVDEDGELASTLAVDVLPQTLVFDEQGRLLRRFRGVLSAVHVDAIRLLLKGP